MTGSNDPCISVVIVNFNAGDRLAKCLRCLSGQSFRDFEIIVVDNDSRDDSIKQARDTGEIFALIEIGDNIGFAAANNRAAALARGRWIAFLNPDAYPDARWLEALVNATHRYPDVDAFGSTQLSADDSSKLDGAGDVFHIFGVPYRGYHGWPVSTIPPEGESFAPCAAAAMYRLATFEALGGFEESFFCYCEDVDLGFRLRLAGGRVIQVRDATVLHEGSGITGRRSDFSVYYGHRNRIWAYFRCMPFALILVTAPFQVTTNIVWLLYHLPSKQLPTIWRALRDGYAGAFKEMRTRRIIQKTRKAPLLSIARALTWSPLKLIKREGDIVPVSPVNDRT